MIQITIAHRGDDLYTQAQRFSQDIYTAQHNATINPQPRVFCVAHHEDCIVGCVGLYVKNTSEKLLIEKYFTHSILTRLPEPHANNVIYGELGTHALDNTKRAGQPNALIISSMMTSALVDYAHVEKIDYLFLTANEHIERHARRCGYDIHCIGTPSTAHMDTAFQSNWKHYFQQQRRCYAMNVAKNYPIAHTVQRYVTRTEHPPAHTVAA